MSRTTIALLVGILIVISTAVAHFSAGKLLRDRQAVESSERVARAQRMLTRTNDLENLGMLRKAEVLGADARLLGALRATGTLEQRNFAQGAFDGFVASGAEKPDILALVDRNGDLIAMDDVEPVRGDWKGADGKVRWPSLQAALAQRVIVGEMWEYFGRGLMRVGIATVIDHNAPPDRVVAGAVVVGYAVTGADAVNLEKDLGAKVGYFYEKDVLATSFRTEAQEDVGKRASLMRVLEEGVQDMVVTTSLDGDDYRMATSQFPRVSTQPLAHPQARTGAVVLVPRIADSVADVTSMIAVLGAVALLAAMLGLYMMSRRWAVQVDRIEMGINDIISGNVDRTFRPVGSELDGLANSLNVMLARLLGRPEPGEEALDEDGNPITRGRVEFDDGAQTPLPSGPDADLARLAAESEPDYYKRVFTEYKQARSEMGAPDEVSYENFIAKLKMNEGKLKSQHQCKAVRFRVVAKDGKVTLKPVPIFA